MSKYLRTFLAYSILLVGAALVFLQSCAQTASPPGGKKDSLAPKILAAFPLNKSKNFNGKKIDLTFNEYITVRNLNQELLITPNVGNFQTRIRPTGLSILLDSALKANTTYTFNFRNAIEDISERNIGKNIKLVFSTGPSIDSLQISGRIKNISTNKKIDNVLVGLYPYHDTLSIDKAKPYYFTKTDTSGIYQLENVAAGKYYLAAFVDLNSNLIYNSNKEAVDFISTPFIDLKQNDSVNFNIALQNQDVLKVSKTIPTAKTVSYEFSRGIKSVSVNNPSLMYQVEGNHTLRFYIQDLNPKDTIKVVASMADSLDRTYQIPLNIKFRELVKREKPIPQVLKFDILPATGRLLSPQDSILIRFQKPIISWKSKDIHFNTGENEEQSLPDDAYRWNAFSNELTIRKDYLPIRKTFDLVFTKHAFISVEKDSSSANIHRLEFQDEENYGSISGEVKGTGNYFVQLLKADSREIVYEVTQNGQFNFPYVEPGIYILRAIHDANKNKRWDIGNFKTKTKPEAIYYFPGQIKLKANFQLTDMWISPN